MDKILLWGGKSKARILINMLLDPNSYDNQFLKSKKIEISGIIDSYLNKPDFNTKIPFTNKKNELKKFINKSNSFIVCIGGEFGKARYLISLELQKRKLKPINLISKYSIIDKTSTIGQGSQIMPNAVVHCFCKLGNFCVLNTSSTIDHECIIGSGVNIMGGATIAGRVIIGDYVTVGTNATIFPDIEIKKGAFIGAGSVVRKNVGEDEVVVGNPSKFLRINKHKFNLDFFR